MCYRFLMGWRKKGRGGREGGKERGREGKVKEVKEIGLKGT